MATLKTAADYAAELGRAQNAYQQYGTAGRKDLQTGASSYADSLRKAATSAGVNLSGLGTKNGYGTDYTSYANGSGAVYDPSKAGRVANAVAPTTPVQAQPEAQTISAPSGPSGPSYSGPSGMDLITSAYQNNLASQMEALRKARETAQQGLNNQETTANQNAYSNRNSADTLALMNLKRVQEQNAANGINGGDSVTATLSNNTDRQNSANSINQDQANRLQDITQQRSLINNSSSADELALVQQLQAARDSAMLGQSNQDRNYGLQLGGLTGVAPGGGLTLDALRRNDANSQFQQSFDRQTGRDQVGDSQWNQTFSYQQVRDSIGDKQYQQKFDQDAKQFGMTYALQQATLNHQISNDVAQNAISSMNASTSRMNAGTSAGSLNWSMDPNNPDNKYKNWSMDPNNPDNLYKNWQMDPSNPNNMPKTPIPSTKQVESQYVGNLNSLITSKGSDAVKKFFKDEQANIINDLGSGGYNSLYGIYFDQNGFPKR